MVILPSQIDTNDVTKNYSYPAYEEFQHFVNDYKPHRRSYSVETIIRRKKTECQK